MPTTPRLELPYPLSTDTADVPRDIKALEDRVEALTAWIRQADFATGAGVHWPGDLKFSAAAVAPVTDWLVCDGASYLRATYPDLFTALGGAASPWGLPDGTHFNVPNFKGRSPMGAGLGTAVGAILKTIGQLTGEERHTMLLAELVAHVHPYEDAAPFNSGLKPVTLGATATTDGTQTTTKNTLPQNPPTATPFNVVHPVAVVNVLIKT